MSPSLRKAIRLVIPLYKYCKIGHKHTIYISPRQPHFVFTFSTAPNICLFFPLQTGCIHCVGRAVSSSMWHTEHEIGQPYFYARDPLNKTIATFIFQPSILREIKIAFFSGYIAGDKYTAHIFFLSVPATGMCLLPEIRCDI